MAQTLHPPVPSGPVDGFHQVPWTCAPSGSLDGLKPHLLLLWVALFLPVPAFVCDSGAVAGALTAEDQSRKATEYLSLVHVPGNQLSHFLPDRAHIFPSLPFITRVPREDFPVALIPSAELTDPPNCSHGARAG